MKVYHATFSQITRQYLPRGLLLLSVLYSPLTPGSEPAPPRIQVLLPQHRNHPQLVQAITQIVAEYNRTQMGAPQDQVDLIHKGDESSSLRDLITLKLAGTLPSLALIEAAEAPVLPALGLDPDFLPPKKAEWEAALGTTLTRSRFPFKSVTLEWIKNHAHSSLNTTAPPQLLAQQLAGPVTPPPDAVCLPAQGPAFLWAIEALAPAPLWVREEGGIRQNQKNAAWLANLFNHKNFAQITPASGFLDLAKDRCLWALVPSTWIPLIEARIKTPFKKAAPLSALLWLPPVQTSEWLVIKPETRVLRFLQFLMNTQNRSLLESLGGFEILGPKKNQRSRLDDADSVKIRSFWIQTLEKLLDLRSQNLTQSRIEDELLILDRLINIR